MQNLDNFNFIFSGSAIKQQSWLKSKFGNSFFWNNYDADLDNIWVGGTSDYGWYYPEFKISFTNQYTDDERWYYDIDIAARINWGLNDYTGKYDKNKLLWNYLPPVFMVGGNFLGLNNLKFPQPFTAHASTDNSYNNSSWPKHQISYDSILSSYTRDYYLNNYINNNSIFNLINKDEYIHNFNNFTNGVPFISWIEIYNSKNHYQFIDNNRKGFEFTGVSYFGYPFNNYFQFSLIAPNNIYYPTVNRNYNVVIYYNNSGIEPTKMQKIYLKESSSVLYNNKTFRKIGNHYNCWQNIYNLSQEYLSTSWGGATYYNTYGDLELTPKWEENQYKLHYFMLRDPKNASSWTNCDLIERTINYGAAYDSPNINHIIEQDEGLQKDYEGFHFLHWATHPLNWLGIEVNVNENCLLDLNHGDNLNLYALYKLNNYTVSYKINKDDIEPKFTQEYNHGEWIYIPRYTPPNNLFNGWRFENGKRLENATQICTENFTLIGSWNADTYTITYNFPIEDEELKNITDNYNLIAKNIKRNQNEYYTIEQLFPEDWINDATSLPDNINKFWGWLDEEGDYYSPGQRINQSVNLVAWNRNDSKIGTVYLSLFDINTYSPIDENVEKIPQSYFDSDSHNFNFSDSTTGINVNFFDFCYGQKKNNIPYSFGGQVMSITSDTSITYEDTYVIKNFLNYRNLIVGGYGIYPIQPLFFTNKKSMFEKFEPLFPVLFKPGYRFDGWWFNGTQFTDGNGAFLSPNYKNILFIDNNIQTIQDKLFYPEFINIMEEQYLPFVLTNRNVINDITVKNINTNDFSRVLTTNWANKNTTFNNSFHFPSGFANYNY